jgi:hypothetical protein
MASKENPLRRQYRALEIKANMRLQSKTFGSILEQLVIVSDENHGSMHLKQDLSGAWSPTIEWVATECILGLHVMH